LSNALFSAPEIKTQRRIWQMRVIVLRPRTYDRALVVIVILIPNIPIKPLVQLDRQPRFGGLKTHRVRRDQRPRSAGRIRDSIPLPVVLIDPISSEDRRARSHPDHRLDKEEVIPDKVETVAQRMLNVIEEVIEFRVAVDPVVVVAGADREPRGCGPVE